MWIRIWQEMVMLAQNRQPLSRLALKTATILIIQTGMQMARRHMPHLCLE